MLSGKVVLIQLVFPVPRAPKRKKLLEGGCIILEYITPFYNVIWICPDNSLNAQGRNHVFALFIRPSVIPAKAGIHLFPLRCLSPLQRGTNKDGFPFSRE